VAFITFKMKLNRLNSVPFQITGSFSEVIGYGLDDRVSIIGNVRNFSLRHPVKSGSGAHPASYQMRVEGPASPFLRSKSDALRS
jgi:hypothetical protein